jgi:GH25 family lysozyme M1 (1,4-beta-N-acetylmuramidase)
MNDIAYAGQFLRQYEPPRVSLNATVNYFLAKPTILRSTALIAQEVMFPDVSFYQGEVNFDIMSTKTEAIILRVGQGKWKDEQFERNYLEAKRTRLLVGGYWFYDGRVSPGEQAALLISILQDKYFELELFIDWERNYGGAHEGLRNVVAMMQVVEAAGLMVKAVGMYTGYFWFKSNSNAIANAGQYNYLKDKPLWEAWYTLNASNVLIPAPWTSLLDWQFGTPVVVWGQKTLEMDMNYFNGSTFEFRERYIVGENMANWRGNAKIVAKVWKDVGLAQTSSVPAAVTVFGDAEKTISGVKYLRITSPVQYFGWTKAEWFVWYYVPVPTPDPEPEPEPTPNPVVTHAIKVYSDGKISVDDGTPY